MLLTLFSLLWTVQLLAASQVPFSAWPSGAVGGLPTAQGRIHLSPDWIVLGPFPAGMREHPLGAFPALALHPLLSLLNQTDPIHVPSTYGKAGAVTAKVVYASRNSAGPDGQISQTVQVSYPELDWTQLRRSTGWSGVQWQALAATDLSVQGHSPVIVSINLDSGAEFAVLAEEEYNRHRWDQLHLRVEWHNGDWYSYNRESVQDGAHVPAHTLKLQPGKYKVIVKSVYEVRVQGDNLAAPQMEYRVDMHILGSDEAGSLRAITVGPYGLAPDIVDGHIAGWGASFALRNECASWVEVTDVQVEGEAREYVFGELSGPVLRIAPLQVRPVRVRLRSVSALPEYVLQLHVTVTFRLCTPRSTLVSTIRAVLPLEHVQLVSQDRHKDEFVTYKYTYLDSDKTVQYAIATPPNNRTGLASDKRPVVMYLHGAGVDVRFKGVQRGLVAQETSWIIQPMGRTPWGYDWQTLSHVSASTALHAFSTHLYGLGGEARRVAAPIDTDKIMVTGHSNGGQGAYHYASRWPDKAIGAVVGAGYMSLADYVPLTWQLGRHFVDAALGGILRSSLNAFDNDLFASNLAGLPLLIKYGRDDDNVPTWHSTEMASLVASWNQDSRAEEELVQIAGVANRSHHWPEFMREDDVQSAIERRVLSRRNPDYQMPRTLDRFTLTVLNPEDSGAKQGWRITQVETPGRLARLEVEYSDGGSRVRVRSSHVSQMQVLLSKASKRLLPQHIEVDGTTITVNRRNAEASDGVLSLCKTRDGWRMNTAESNLRPLGPMIRFLSSPGPIQVIVPSQCSPNTTAHYLSIARRFATDAFLFGRIDTVILHDYEVGGKGARSPLDHSNLLLLGGPTVNAVSRIVATSQHLVDFLDGSSQFTIRGRTFAAGTTLLALFPHPLASSQDGTRSEGVRPMALLLHGTDALSIERGYSLLPVRTGVLLPEWIVVDKASLWKGYGGVVGAGWYDAAWSWSEAMSYLS